VAAEFAAWAIGIFEVTTGYKWSSNGRYRVVVEVAYGERELQVSFI
jgi:hypothetical protein